MTLSRWTAAATFALAGVTFAQAPLGSNPGALPPGHPPMGAAGGTAMPPGHPPMGGAAGKTLPPGHPPMGGSAGAGAPSMADILSANPNIEGAATRPAAVTGSLTITAVPGTAGAPAIAKEPVTVELYHRGSPIKKLELPLDKDGKVVFPDLPVMPPVQALVSINHGGLLQQIVTPELNPQDPNQTLQMRVFETTEQMPAWSVAMQHVIVQWSQDGTSARVTEMLSCNTPGDRAWIGTKTADTKRVTLALPLPPGADQIELGGLDEEASTIQDGKLVTSSALFPGRSEIRIGYIVPAKDGNLELPIAAPAYVGALKVFLPADETQVTATGLTGGDPVAMGGGNIRMFQAQGLAAGTTVNLSIKGIKPTPVDEHDHAAPVAQGKFSARNVAMAGAFLMVLGGLALMLMKKNPSKKGAA
jgi:hypothetical protein